MVKVKPQMYEARDGREFDNEEDARRYDELLAAHSAFEDAHKHYVQLLSQSFKTADGYPFEFGSSYTYFYVQFVHNGPPRLSKLSWGWWDLPDVRLDGDGGILLPDPNVDANNKKSDRRYRVSVLYKLQNEANKELLRQFQTYYDDVTGQLNDLKSRVQL